MPFQTIDTPVVIAVHAPDRSDWIPSKALETVVVIDAQIPEKKETIPFHTPEKKDFTEFQTPSQFVPNHPRKTSAAFCSVFKTVPRMFLIPSQMEPNTSFTPVHA